MSQQMEDTLSYKDVGQLLIAKGNELAGGADNPEEVLREVLETAGRVERTRAVEKDIDPQGRVYFGRSHAGESGMAVFFPDEIPGGMEDFTEDLRYEGVEVYSAMNPGDTASILYLRDPDAHREQLETIAKLFVEHRGLVGEGESIGLTGLESENERHGVTAIPREMADMVANGDISEDEYVQMIVDGYDEVNNE